MTAVQPAYESTYQCGRAPRWLIILTLAFIVLVALGILALACWLVSDEIAAGMPLVSALLIDGIYFIPVVFLLVFAYGMGCRALAWYRFEPEGVWVRFPLRKPELFRWEDFQQVCVCYGNSLYKGEKHQPTVICCVRRGEQKNFHDRWKSDGPLHYRGVLCIDYTPELHLGIAERCPYPVVDLRNTYAYRGNT